MSIITSEEIQKLYKKCGAYENNNIIRNTINQGTLNNKLITMHALKDDSSFHRKDDAANKFIVKRIKCD